MIRSSIIEKLLALPAPVLNLVFIVIMIGGSVLILGSLYLIYDVQIFGERTSSKIDLMLVSITFTIIHVSLTSSLLFALKKTRYSGSQKQPSEATLIKKESSGLDKILSTSPVVLNLIFVGVMIGGSVLILGSLYMIYDVQIFGQRSNSKMDLMIVSIVFAAIHVLLTGASSSVFKKMRYAKTLIQKEKEEIAKIDKAKDEFAAMIAHELKNPLVPIQSYSRMLLDGRFGNLTEVQKEKMKIIISGTDSMLVLIQDILDVHKAELGKMGLDLRSSDMCQIANGAIEKTKPLAEKRGITLCNEIVPKTTANADRHRIEQVLVNLIKNAIDFVPVNSGIIQIRARLHDTGITISVSDNGCGIAKKELDGLFQKFYQSNTAQNRERNSNGLGLAICRSIIELHGGKIWAESEIDKGTSIKFVLPTSNLLDTEKTTLESTL